MSSSSISKPYFCLSDCQYGGCPGHTIKLTFHRTSDTTSIQIDDQPTTVFDDNAFEALCLLMKERDYDD